MPDDDDLQYTWDGRSITREPPYGAMIVVYRRTSRQVEFLVLHRQHHGPDFEGDWAWGPPSGARFPGEQIGRCAERELLEETGLGLGLTRVDMDSPDWFVYSAEAPRDASVHLSDEHDRYAWLPLTLAAARVAPEIVRAHLLTTARLTLAGD